MNEVPTVDPIWEQKYSQGHVQHYPWDLVVSFLFTHRPRHKPREETKVLEVGCGTGSNLWCAAREGFQVAGIDASATAIEYARKRFADEGLEGDWHVGDFSNLSFADGTFDMVIDRAAITCCGLAAARRVVGEVGRVMVAGGKFLCNCYSDHHSSYAAGELGADGLMFNISAGSLEDEGQICFYSRRDLDALFPRCWRHISIEHMERSERLTAECAVHAEWRVITEKGDL